MFDMRRKSSKVERPRGYQGPGAGTEGRPTPKAARHPSFTRFIKLCVFLQTTFTQDRKPQKRTVMLCYLLHRGAGGGVRVR